MNKTHNFPKEFFKEELDNYVSGRVHFFCNTYYFSSYNF